MTKRIEKNKQLIKEFKNFLNKAIISKIVCFNIIFEIKSGSFKEKVLDEIRIKYKDILSSYFENIEFYFAITTPGKKVKINIVLGIRPILSPELNRKVIFANLCEQFLLYDFCKLFNTYFL